MISRIITLLDSNIQFSTNITEQTKKQVSVAKEKIDKSTETIQEKYLMVHLIDKGFKTVVLKVLKELKEHVEKAKKTMHEQNGKINKEIADLKKKDEILEVKSTTKTKNSREIQRQI